MKKITKYKAEDGKEFNKKDECIEYEATAERIEKIIERLQKPPKDDGCRFANGHGYLQHDMATVMSVWNDLLDEFSSRIDHQWIKESKNMKCDASWVARLVGDYNIPPYYKAWDRMNNIDKDGREFGQPYYKTNPDKADLYEIKA